MRSLLSLSLVFAALLPLASCSEEVSRNSIELIVEVDTPTGLQTGSSTIQFVYEAVPKWLPNGGGSSVKTIGDAVVVDLGEGRHLYALLNAGADGREVSWLNHPLRLADDGTITDKSLLPMLVTFTDEADPSSIVEVQADDFRSAFGPGYNLRKIRAVPSAGPLTREALDSIPLFRDTIFKMSREQPVGGSGDRPRNRPYVTPGSFRLGKKP